MSITWEVQEALALCIQYHVNYDARPIEGASHSANRNRKHILHRLRNHNDYDLEIKSQTFNHLSTSGFWDEFF